MEYTGQALTESFEGCRLVAYQDQNGVWTIGYGHTQGVAAGMTCTQEQAQAWLLEDIQWAVSVVNSQVTVSLTQNEFNALVDFVYNVGSGNFTSSTTQLVFAANEVAAKSFAISAQPDGVVQGLHTGHLSFRVVSADANFNGIITTPIAVNLQDGSNNAPTGTVSISQSCSLKYSL